MTKIGRQRPIQRVAIATQAARPGRTSADCVYSPKNGEPDFGDSTGAGTRYLKIPPSAGQVSTGMRFTRVSS